MSDMIVGRGTGRREFIRLAGAVGVAGLFWKVGGARVLAGQVVKEIHELKPGEFTWHPERAPSGPVAVVVSIPDQRVHVYRNGVRIAVSTCSTGKPGHETPTGVFTVLEKDKHHHSSTYSNAPMPNMNRLTWSGVALHAGNLPGYPASHGCVRLPMGFSELLFGVTHVGTPVIIAGGHHDPAEVVHPGLVLSQYAEHEFEDVVAKLKGKSVPSMDHADNPTPPTSVLISRADQRAFVLESGKIVAEGVATIRDPHVPLGSHVFVLSDTHDERRGLAWHAIGHHAEQASGFAKPEEDVIRRVGADSGVVEAMKARMHPGMVLVMTDMPAHPDTRSGHDFVVMTQEGA
jgi:hypothetical protein